MVAAYGLAMVSLLVPLALVGAVFAGIALMRRHRQADGMGVILVAAVATALGIVLLR